MNAWLSVKLLSIKLWITKAKLARQDELLLELNQDYTDAMRGKRGILRDIKRLESDLIKAEADLMTVRAISPRRRFPLGF